MRRLLALTATATALAAAVAAAPSASAETQTTSDPRGDTVVLAPRQLAAPVAQGVDITRVRTVYEGQKVKVVLTVANLGAVGSDNLVEYVARARSGQEDWVFGIIKQGPQVQALMQPTQPPVRQAGWLARATGRGVQECTPGYDIDKKADTVTLVATRDCLGAGGSVRTGAIAAVMTQGGDFRADDGRRKGQVSPSAADIKLGKAVDRN